MHGSMLDRGGNSTQVVRLALRPAGEVDRSIVVPVVDGSTFVACPRPLPPDVLDVATGVARLRRGEEPVGLDQLASVPAALVAQLAAGFCEGCVGEPASAGTGAVELLLAEHPGRVQTFDHDRAVGLGKPRGQVVDVVYPDVSDPAVEPGDLFIRCSVLAGSLLSA
jgi:hypothetical protein